MSSIMKGKWTVLECINCGCVFAYRQDTYKDEVGNEVCPDCDVIDTRFLGWQIIED
jgi:hypothetical protein